MPITYGRLTDFLGTGSILQEDLFGNTIESGAYTLRGIDLWSLPGVVAPKSHVGTFKKGPIGLYVSSSDRHYWWAAKIQDTSTPVLEVYSINPMGSTLRYTSSLMPDMPRSFDFELNQDGHIVAVAEIEEKLYAFYSFSSSLGWQLIASESFTPKMVSIDGAVGLAFVNNNFTFSSSQNWWPNVQYTLTDGMFTTSSTKWLTQTPVPPNQLPDSMSLVPLTYNNVYYGWSGSLSGTLDGTFTGSLKGRFTGSFGNGLNGSFKITPPTILYERLYGHLDGIFGGNFSGSATATGAFYGTLNGTFSGTYYTASAGIVTSFTQGTSTAPTGINFFSGSISGGLNGCVYPHSRSLVKPLYFLHDFLPTLSNRLELTWGQYNPATQEVSYTQSLSSVNVTAYPVNSVVGGGVPFSMEVYHPTSRITAPFLQSEMAYDSNGLDGSSSISGPRYGASQLFVTNFKIANGSGRYYFHTTMWNPSTGQRFDNYAVNTYDYSANGNTGIHNAGGLNEINWGRVAGDVGAASNPIVTSPYQYALLGIIFPSQSRYATTFDGSHIIFSASYASGTAAFRIYQYYNTATEQHIITSGTTFVGTPIVPSYKDVIYSGVKLKPLLTEPLVSFSCSIVADPASNFVGTSASLWQSMSLSSSTQVVLVRLPSFIYSPVVIGGTATVSGSPPPFGSKTWYPDVTLSMCFTGSTSGIKYQTTMSTTSYFLHTNQDL